MSLDENERKKLREFGWAVLLAGLRWVLEHVAGNPGKDKKDGTGAEPKGGVERRGV